MEEMIKNFINLKRNEVSHLSKRGIEGKNGLLLVCRNADIRFKHLLIDVIPEKTESKKPKSPKTSNKTKTTKTKKSK